MNELKYIVTDQGDFAIFTKLSEHAKIAPHLYGKAIGAGFCTIARQADTDKANVHCYGRSVSSNLESRPEDEGIINSKI